MKWRQITADAKLKLSLMFEPQYLSIKLKCMIMFNSSACFKSDTDENSFRIKNQNQVKSLNTAVFTGMLSDWMNTWNASYLCDLHAPVEQQLGADVPLVFMYVVPQAAVGHELSYQLNSGTQADPQKTH